MTEPSPSGSNSSSSGGSSHNLSSSEAAAGGIIPSGLNRIKTRRVSSKDQLTSRPNDEFTDSKGYAVAAATTAAASSSSSSRPPVMGRQKKQLKSLPPGRGGVSASSSLKNGGENNHQGKKIARWFTSYFLKDNNQVENDGPLVIEERSMEPTVLDRKELTGTRIPNRGNHLNGNQSSSESVSQSKVPKGIKSFSHELGRKGGIPPPAHPRAHSYSDLKELLGSLHSRFDAAKEVVDVELASFAGDAMDVLDKIESSLKEEKRMAEDLLILAQLCMEMNSSQFRSKCERIVHDLTEKRQLCQTGLLKWLFSRLLFILTRCTRLLQFQKGSERLDEKSLHNFKKCLERIPSVEMSWVANQGIADSEPICCPEKGEGKEKLQVRNNVSSFSESLSCRSAEPEAISRKDSMVSEKKFAYKKFNEDSVAEVRQSPQADNGFNMNSVSNSNFGSHHGQQRSSDDSLQDQEQLLDLNDSVICRICEESVPISHLESHSYICAYADKCDLNCLDVDERLSNLAEILEQIVESRNVHPSCGSPENSRIQTASSVSNEGYSPKISEWRNKGVEGMFEDIHEMDTAFIDDSQLSSINLKSHLGIKLCNNGTPSSTGSVTSVSSTNTPRAGHFDSFWLECNNPSELEDVQQMVDLADIARCVSSTDLSKEESYEFLLACLQDLQDILQHSKLKALVIDTFGGRIEKLLREKYILACDVMDTKSPTTDGKPKENFRVLFDNASQSSATSTPVHSSHRERITIDDFEIIKPISRGAFGKVFLARKRTTGDLFAIKVLKKLDMLRKNDVQRILAERNILITVRNPFVVRFFYSFTCRDNLYLVMEYLNGGDLYSLLRKLGCLEEDVARIYIAELVLALEYLHSLGIVHRDLKPDNILIAHDGHIKLTDFGLSKIGLINSTMDLSGHETNGDASPDALKSCTQQAGDTSRRSAVGTPDYLAPEILLGTEHGYASDWWSVGIILFELITGIPPFTAEHPELIFDNILNRKIPWPSVPDDMSYEAQDLINRLIVHDPKQRLGANGSIEVKAHPFFRGVDWDNLAMQKAAFVPNPDSADDTSYFVSRFSQMSAGIPNDQDIDHSDSDTYDSNSNSGDETDECGDLAEFNSLPLDLSLINFSFKNLSQLASINHDVLLQTEKDRTKSPSRAPHR